MGRIYELHVEPEGEPVAVEALDGDPDRVEIAERDAPAVEGSCRFTCGRPVIPDLVPTRMRWGGRPGQSIPDFDESLILNVSGRARGLIEALEPTLHQFLAVTYYDGEGQWVEQRYFLIPCRRIESLDPERSRLPAAAGRWHATFADAAADLVDEAADALIVFSLARIGRAHLWHDPSLPGGPFVSETLARALKASGMRGLAWDRSFEAR